ncbi:hypothetical protein RhiirA1_446798 [Rhizophagus irregularis]|uniref:Uncharacterized protein n=3 Tax=Rhizophagus irregularis TaxID=588596 RepID=A0A2I1EHQ7_9GLOM|nr:hypothetical protein GLOIN_2v1704138 [Rhizophagus irregularis DAOM 181602=DAOM 197198]EXX55874.1 hypothetical protein RirG_221390 [Rhizophagus irregularis DAOM 197198w]PKC55534.1 hypothetical protein RhiirA1_446798 [Rhizophagus irregularis]PKK60119.1 hypothetical protein RhiirC2_793798 [Rhizophagus irregularis]PKY21657.1 hypothetical protein RhiirB3_501023 [Rhizophagus irregularis]POG61420.1 hypothetical protein GLOIN_2v1704138 [Rhizophagus irregularis DAOM 181602=DAOM 197198]|eukprot:XP_025168286.1 hypothetical protein GLOIN_2v1704138 [Rhizophagus irregularis DAOM 181602=DAOM 197198]
MAYKLSLIFVNIIILVLLSTFAYSAPYNNTTEHNENDIIKEQDDNFICLSGSNIACCPQLAHHVASKYHSRCASIVLINKSGYNMVLDIINLEDGRWVTSDDYDDIDINCEPHSLLNDESEAISSVTSHFLGGISSVVIFTIDDDISSSFFISWNVPTIGSPKYLIEFFDKSSKDKYSIITQKTFRNTVFRIEIHKRIPWTWSILPLLVFFIAIPCCYIPMIMKESEFRERLLNSTSWQQKSYNSNGQSNQSSNSNGQG